MNVTHIFRHGRTKAAPDDAKILFGFRVSFVELSHATLAKSSIYILLLEYLMKEGG